jgi:hypothetical protein
MFLSEPRKGLFQDIQNSAKEHIFPRTLPSLIREIFRNGILMARNITNVGQILKP